MERSTGGRYIYCVARGAEVSSLGRIGIEGREVYGVCSDGLSAIVHDVPPDQSVCQERERLVDWAVAHQQVVVKAWEAAGTVLPMRFHTVIKGGADELRDWLRGSRHEFMAKLERLTGREEYGVQLFMDEKRVADRLLETVSSLVVLKAAADGASAGTAFMRQQLMEKELRRETARETERYFEAIFVRLRDVTERIIAEETKAATAGARMIMNLSVLLPREGVEELIKELEMVDSMEEIAVRLTGPWPPYSFADI